MLRRIFLSLVAGWLMPGVASETAIPSPSAPVVSHPQPLIGSQTFQSGGACITLAVGIDDKSINDLELSEGPSGWEFRKNAHLITQYPDTISLEIFARRADCLLGAAVSKLQQRIEPTQLKFQVVFIENGVPRPAEITSPEWKKQPWTESSQEWDADFTVKTRGFALADEFVVIVKSDADKELFRFPRKLSGPPTIDGVPTVLKIKER